MVVTLDNIKITPEILSLIAEIDEFKGAWRALGTLAPDRLAALRRVATVESIGSSTRIEGSKLSDLEVERFLSNLDIATFATRDEQEVAGYAEVMEVIFESWAEIDLTENHIKQFHRDLLKYSTKDEYHRGEYKKNENRVEAFDEGGRPLGTVFATASPFDTPGLMRELVEVVNAAANTGMHPLLVIGAFVVSLLAIHPFQDGNGRLSRVLTTLLLMRYGYAYVPFSSLESVIEQNKEGYYLALRQTQATLRSDAPNWQPWMIYFLRALVRQKKNLEAKVEREKIVLAVLPELSIKILEHAREHGHVSVADIVRLTGASRNTLKDHFRRLRDDGHLVLVGKGRGAFYRRP